MFHGGEEAGFPVLAKPEAAHTKSVVFKMDKKDGSALTKEPAWKEKETANKRNGTQVVRHGGNRSDKENQAWHTGKGHEMFSKGNEKENLDGKNRELEGKTSQKVRGGKIEKKARSEDTAVVERCGSTTTQVKTCAFCLSLLLAFVSLYVVSSDCCQ